MEKEKAERDNGQRAILLCMNLQNMAAFLRAVSKEGFKFKSVIFKTHVKVRKI